MARDVDDVVDAAHHEQVAVVVDVATVPGRVVAREGAHVGLDEAVVRLPESGERPGRQREPHRDGAFLVRAARPPALSERICDVVAGHGLGG